MKVLGINCIQALEKRKHSVNQRTKTSQKSHIPLSNYMHIHCKSVYIEVSSFQMICLNSLLADHIACGKKKQLMQCAVD